MEIQKHLEEEVVNLIRQGVRYFGSGGALGFDTIAALTIIKLKLSYPSIKLILVLPCKEQCDGWSKENIEVYNGICEKADKIVYTSDYYYTGCMHKRNRHLVDNCKYCICYLNRLSGGTAYTVKYAVCKGLSVINIAD